MSSNSIEINGQKVCEVPDSWMPALETYLWTVCAKTGQDWPELFPGPMPTRKCGECGLETAAPISHYCEPLKD